MEIPDQNNPTKSDALFAMLNEEKGNLFEFLVAQFLSRQNKIEAQFFSELNFDLKNNLAVYEDSLRRFHPDIIPKLSVLSENTAKELDFYLRQKKVALKNIFVVGKITANFEKEEWHESDLLLKTKQDILIPVSLKLSKDNSYMNTKSAGAKSFIEKYFHNFKEAKDLQQLLNKEIDQAFLQMGHRLYQMASLPFMGKFDESWKEKWSELPGELPKEFREVIFVNYNRVASLLHQYLNDLLHSNKDQFLYSLGPLCGVGDRNMIQVSCYHQEHTLKSIEIKEHKDFFYEGMDFSIEPIKEHLSSFDIILGETRLQIRVKPMNKFTTPSYKINCSVKFHRNSK